MVIEIRVIEIRKIVANALQNVYENFRIL